MVAPDAPVVLKVEHLNAGKMVQDVSFELRKGEILGFSGLMGAGRTELAMSIFGKSYGTKISGQVFINGKLVTSPSASLKEDDLVTVRHMGKFRYVGVQNQTKKGRLYVAVERFVS